MPRAQYHLRPVLILFENVLKSTFQLRRRLVADFRDTKQTAVAVSINPGRCEITGKPIANNPFRIWSKTYNIKSLNFPNFAHTNWQQKCPRLDHQSASQSKLLSVQPKTSSRTGSRTGSPRSMVSGNSSMECENAKTGGLQS